MNISSVTDMKAMFNEYNSLISLPNISKWNAFNLGNINYLFFGCISLISIPDISKWNNNNNLTNINHIFDNCFNILNTNLNKEFN